MRSIVGIIALLSIPYFYKNVYILFLLIYLALWFIEPVNKFLKIKLKINLGEFALAVFLVVYGLIWFVKKTIKRWCANLVILFFVLLQFFLKMFKQFKTR